MRRTLGVLVAVISAAALLSACGGVGGPAAAKVGDTTILRSTLDEELTVLTDNERWMQAVSQNSEGDLAAPEGGASTKLSAAWLGTMLNQAIVDQVFENRDLTVTAEDRAAGQQAADGIFAGRPTFNQFPKWFRDRMLRNQARYAAVAATVPPREPPTDETLQQYFRNVTPQVCSSRVAVLEIKVDTQEAADAIVTELAQGADFATLAEQRSQEAESAAGGGLAVCKDTQQYAGLPDAMRQAIDPLGPGSVSGVVPVDSAFYVFKVEPWSFELARPVMRRLYESTLVAPADEFVELRLNKAKVWIDPRYGSVVRQGPRIRVDPPVAPVLRDDPPLTSSTTAPAGATTP